MVSLDSSSRVFPLAPAGQLCLCCALPEHDNSCFHNRLIVHDTDLKPRSPPLSSVPKLNFRNLYFNLSGLNFAVILLFLLHALLYYSLIIFSFVRSVLSSSKTKPNISCCCWFPLSLVKQWGASSLIQEGRGKGKNMSSSQLLSALPSTANPWQGYNCCM